MSFHPGPSFLVTPCLASIKVWPVARQHQRQLLHFIWTGICGNRRVQVNNGGRDVLRGFRGALYLGIGLAGLDVVVSICFMFMSWWQHRKESVCS